ncbi:MAG: 30S ribosomal protein S20 [Candidatus Spechtbacterales bacterium]
MPQLPNAKKALRKSQKEEAHNRQYKNRVKKAARKIDDLLKEGKKEEAEKLLPIYFKAIDKATKINIFHKNTANRRKSLYARRVSGNEKNQVSAKNQDATAAESSSQDK